MMQVKYNLILRLKGELVVGRIVVFLYLYIRKSYYILHFLTNNTTYYSEICSQKILQGVQTIEVRTETYSDFIRSVAYYRIPTII